jgi:alkylation response protein AidB-like acyl-CoA dehydrogenase
VLLGGALVLAAGTEEQKADLLARVAEGRELLAFAHHERNARYDLNDVAVRAGEHGGEWRLNGQKSLVLNGEPADTLIVSARISGNRRDRGGIGLFLVGNDARGLVRRGYRTQDNLRAAEVSFEATPATPLGTPTGKHFAIIERVIDHAIAALCAEAVGAMQALHAMTVDYLKTRRQFGRAIGEFQVLQHRAVDMFTALEQARSMALFAAVMAEEDAAAERARAIAAAKVQIGRSGRYLGQEAIQLHGGIAVTMEYAAGHYFKRLTMIDKMFGDADWHLSRLAEAGGLFGRPAA